MKKFLKLRIGTYIRFTWLSWSFYWKRYDNYALMAHIGPLMIVRVVEPCPSCNTRPTLHHDGTNILPYYFKHPDNNCYYSYYTSLNGNTPWQARRRWEGFVKKEIR